MAAGTWVMMALLISSPAQQQRGVVSGVVVPDKPAQAGAPVAITITGRNPCGAVRVDPGDGSERITHAITHVPFTVQYVYRRSGRFEVRAEGMGNCDGVAATSIQVTPSPAPSSAGPTRGRVSEMDADHDGVVTRAEWRGDERAFRNHDTNGDGVLSGAEVRDEPDEVRVTADRWTSTGIYVHEGDLIRVASAGTVQLSGNAGDTSSPGGAGSARTAPSAPMPDRPAGGLIARIGSSHPVFVGADPEFRANASGELYLGVNDGYLADNRGEYRVTIDAPRHGHRRR